MAQATFYFDLGSPFAYLAAERIEEMLGTAVRWQPISLGALFKLNGRSSWALGSPESRATGIADVEHRAQTYGLPTVRWPDPWPGNYLMAMRAATFADQAGLGREFAVRAFRDAFQEGRDLSTAGYVLQAAENVGLDPREVQAASEDPLIKLTLREETDTAHARGVFGVPTLAIDNELFWGEDRLEDAAAALESTDTE